MKMQILNILDEHWHNINMYKIFKTNNVSGHKPMNEIIKIETWNDWIKLFDHITDLYWLDYSELVNKKYLLVDESKMKEGEDWPFFTESILNKDILKLGVYLISFNHDAKDKDGETFVKHEFKYIQKKNINTAISVDTWIKANP